MNIAEALDSVKTQMSKSPKEFWLTAKVKSYFTNVAKAILDKYGSDFNIIINVIFDENAPIACTNFNQITLNAGCLQVQKIIRLEYQFLYLKGLMAHELTHLLWMDKNLVSMYYRTLEIGKMFPRIPNGNEEIIADMMETIKNPRSAKKYIFIAKNLINSIEDGYGENTFIQNYYGNLVEGMHYMRQEFKKDLDDVRLINDEFLSEDNNISKCTAIMKIILQYCLYHEVKNFSNNEYEILEELEKGKTIINRTLSENFRERLNSTNELIAVYWEFFKPFIHVPEEEKSEENKENSDDNNSDSQNSNGNTSNSNGSGNENNGDSKNNSESENNSKSSKQQNDKNKNNNQSEIQPDFNSGKPDMGEGKTVALVNNVENTTHDDIISRVVAEIKTPNEDFSDLIEQSFRELAEKRLEEKALSQMKENANGDYYGCKTIIERPIDISSNMISEYENFSDAIYVSRNLQRKFKRELDAKRKGGKQTNLYMGRKVEIRSVIRNDGKCFYNNKLPQLTPRVCIYMVLDESGSMDEEVNRTSTRIEEAKKTAVLIEDFCRELKFPVEIIGSTADHNYDQSSELTIYSSFDSVDGNDKFRLMNIESKSCNRDGAALNYAYSRLVKRQEEVKILFYMSDGKPNAYNYGGQKAIDDIQKILDKCNKKNIVVIAAAVGDDKEAIERIYGNNFLDVTDMEHLPDIFISKIKRFFKR